MGRTRETGTVVTNRDNCARPFGGRVGHFFLLSILLHLCVLALSAPLPPNTPSPNALPPIKATLLAAKPPAEAIRPPAPTARKTPRPAVARSAATAIDPPPSPSPAAAPPIMALAAPADTERAVAVAPAAPPLPESPPHAAPARAAAPAPPSAEAPDPAALAAYTRVLTGEVARAKRYPAVARLRGWQGTAVLSLTVSANGQVTGSELRRSSGFPVLDDQALRMVAEVMPLPLAPSGLLGRPLVIELPVVFTLAAS